ncbi:MAG: toxin-antitoxin system HicB family antitoxin [Bacteroidetes bacterium]|nr:MAG: toxin-antitoxin system HicB family antitoxin [Bacteroidota bacterium]
MCDFNPVDNCLIEYNQSFNVRIKPELHKRAATVNF